MNDMILLKPGELVLKGLNRHFFEDRLRANVERRLKGLGHFRITSVQSTIYVEPLSDYADMDEAYRRCKQVFGIVTVCRAAACPKDEAEIANTAVEYLHDELAGAKSYKVESRRSDKSFHLGSI